MPKDNLIINAGMDNNTKEKKEDVIAHPKWPLKELSLTALAATNGALYFFVAAAGAENYQKLFQLEKDSPSMKAILYGFGLGSSICFSAFNYMVFKNLTIKPTHAMSCILVGLSPISASSFLTAGKQGAEYIGLNEHLALGLGLAMYAFRMITMIDGDVKFPKKATELSLQIKNAMADRDYKDMIRMFITLYAALGFCASGTDAIYSTINLFMKSVFDINDDHNAAVIVYTLVAILGALGFFPMAYYWTKRGINQLTFGGKLDESGINNDPSDWNTIVAAASALPVVAGCLGSVTQSNGSVFGKLGTFATAVRISSSGIYAIAGGVPGLSTLSKNLTKGAIACRNRFFPAHDEGYSILVTQETASTNRYNAV